MEASKLSERDGSPSAPSPRRIPQRVFSSPLAATALAFAALTGCDGSEAPTEPWTPGPRFSHVEVPLVEITPLNVVRVDHGYFDRPFSRITDVFGGVRIRPAFTIASAAHGQSFTYGMQALDEHKLAVRMPPDGYTSTTLQMRTRWNHVSSSGGTEVAVPVAVTFDDLSGVAPASIEAVARVDSWGLDLFIDMDVLGDFEFSAVRFAWTLPDELVLPTGQYEDVSGPFIGVVAIGPLLSILDLRSPEVRIGRVVQLLQDMNLPEGTRRPVQAKLDAALASVTSANANQRADAAGHLGVRRGGMGPGGEEAHARSSGRARRGDRADHPGPGRLKPRSMPKMTDAVRVSRPVDLAMRRTQQFRRR